MDFVKKCMDYCEDIEPDGGGKGWCRGVAVHSSASSGIQAMDFASFVKENCARHARLEPVSQPTLPPSARAPPRPAAGAKTCKVCTEHRGVSDAPYSRID